MKNIFIIIIAFTLFSCNTKKEKQLADKTHILEIGRGKFAFCGASGAVPTGRKIIIQGKTFDEGCAICPVIDGLSIANMELLNYSWDTPDGTDSTVWSLFWYFDSVPQWWGNEQYVLYAMQNFRRKKWSNFSKMLWCFKRISSSFKNINAC